jgi:hypothetical protein
MGITIYKGPPVQNFPILIHSWTGKCGHSANLCSNCRSHTPTQIARTLTGSSTPLVAVIVDCLLAEQHHARRSRWATAVKERNDAPGLRSWSVCTCTSVHAKRERFVRSTACTVGIGAIIWTWQEFICLHHCQGGGTVGETNNC